MTLTKEQFKQLYDKGLSVEQIVAFSQGKTPNDIRATQQTQNQAQPGFFSSLITDPYKTLIARPAARLAQATAAGIGALVGGKFNENIQQQISQPMNLGGVTIEPQKPIGQGGATQILGNAAEAASYLYGGGEAGLAAKAGLKGRIIQGALTGAKAGAVGGGLYSFGDAIQQAETQPSDVAYKTLLGTAAGGALGLGLGAVTPIAVKGFGVVKTLTDLNSLENKLYTQNRDILRPTSSQLADWKQAQVDPIKTFTKEFGPEAIPSRNGQLQLDEMIAQTDARYKAGSEGFNAILRNSPERVNLTQVEDDVVTNIRNSGLTPSQKEIAIAKARSEAGFLRQEAQRSGNLVNDSIPAWYADHFKDRYWGATHNFGSEESTVANTVNRSYGFALKNGIEGVIKDVNVRNYNKKLQELITLRDFLESRNGKTPGTGGKMSRYVARIVGSVAGSHGGPVGSIAGAITADKIAQAIVNPESQTWILRKQLANLSPEARQTLQAEAEKILGSMTQKRAEVLKLPPPTPLGTAENPIIPPAPTTFEPQAQNIYRDTSQPPITTPQTTINKNQSIRGDLTTIPKELQPLAQEAMKYKSAEDFIKTRQVMYHGSPTPLKSFSNKKGGVFFTDNYFDATGFGGSPDNVYEGYLNFRKPLVIDARGAKWNELNTKYGKTTQEVVANAQKAGFDGVTFKNIVDNVADTADVGGQSTISYAFKPKDAFLNESQLTDLWQKIHKK